MIILTGLPVSGKTKGAKIVGKKLNIPLYETGPYVYHEVESRGLEVTPENIKKVTKEVKAITDSYFTEAAVKDMTETHPDAPAYFLAGVRALSEVDYLYKTFGEENVFIISFHCSRKTRFQRLDNPDRQAAVKKEGSKGHEDAALKNWENFIARDLKEISFGVGTLISLADYMLITDERVWPYMNVRKTVRILEVIVREILGEKWEDVY